VIHEQQLSTIAAVIIETLGWRSGEISSHMVDGIALTVDWSSHARTGTSKHVKLKLDGYFGSKVSVHRELTKRT
jgi:hypothetical protein